MRSLRAGASGWVVVVLLAASAAADPIRMVRQQANDLIYDPATKQIDASAPGPSWAGGRRIVGIDPDTGQIGSDITVNGEPGKLAISSQGRYLYAALDGGASVIRADTVAQTAGLRFSTDTGSGARAVDDMAVLPGHPESVALSLGGVGVFVYDNGAPRLQSAPGGGALAFLDSTNRLYGYGSGVGFRRMTVDAAGITVNDVTAGLISGAGVEIQYDQGLLVTTSGQVIDPEARLLLGTFTGLGAGAPVAADVKRGRVYYLLGEGSTAKLLAFDPHTFLQVGSWEIPGIDGHIASLIRWGQERADGGGLAFRTSGGQVFLIYLGQLDHHPVEFSLSSDLDPDPFRRTPGGTTITVRVRLTAPAPADGATLQISSDSPSVATAPPSVTIPAGVASGSFLVTTRPVATATSVRITASAGDVSHTLILPLSPPELASLTMRPNSVRGDATVTGTVALTGPAPAGGVTVALGGVEGIPSVTLAAGATMASFPVIVHGHFSITTVPVVARLVDGPLAGVDDLTTNIEVGPAPPVLSAIVYNPANGHWYQEAQVPGTGIAWEEAKAAAEALTYQGYRGHLATITSAEENQFIHTQVPHAHDPGIGHSLGGLGPGGVKEPYPGWTWITGEPWGYTSFYGHEPRSVSTSEALLVLRWDGSWEVTETPGGALGFIVEYEPPLSPPGTPIAPGRQSALPQLILFPNPVFGGQLAEGQVVWPEPIGPDGGVTVTSSNPAVASVSSCCGAIGDSVIPFVITTVPVAASTSVTITAHAPGGSVTATLVVAPLPPPLASTLPPPDPPAAPTDLAVTGFVSYGVGLTWINHSDNATTVSVWRKSSGTDWVRVGLEAPNGAGSTGTAIDIGLAPGVTYTYRVCALNGIRPSDWSNEVTVTVP